MEHKITFENTYFKKKEKEKKKEKKIVVGMKLIRPQGAVGFQ